MILTRVRRWLLLLATFLTEITQLLTGLLTKQQQCRKPQISRMINRQFLSHYYKCTKLTFDWCHDFCCFLYRITTVLLSTSNLIMITDFSAALEKRLWDFHFICEYIMKIANCEVFLWHHSLLCYAEKLSGTSCSSGQGPRPRWTQSYSCTCPVTTTHWWHRANYRLTEGGLYVVCEEVWIRIWQRSNFVHFLAVSKFDE